MTIKISIENHDAERVIEVREVDYNKRTHSAEEGPAQPIAPGERRTYHVHLLRDIRINERKP